MCKKNRVEEYQNQDLSSYRLNYAKNFSSFLPLILSSIPPIATFFLIIHFFDSYSFLPIAFFMISSILAAYLGFQFLNEGLRQHNLILPLTRNIYSLTKALETIARNSGDSTDPDNYCLVNFLNNVKEIRKNHLYRIEQDILHLNQTLVKTSQLDVREEIEFHEKKLHSLSDVRMKSQLEKNLEVLRKKETTQRQIKERIARLTLLLIEIEARLELFFSTTKNGQLSGVEIDSLNTLDDLQFELDSYYQELEQLEYDRSQE